MKFKKLFQKIVYLTLKRYYVILIKVFKSKMFIILY